MLKISVTVMLFLRLSLGMACDSVPQINMLTIGSQNDFSLTTCDFTLLTPKWEKGDYADVLRVNIENSGEYSLDIGTKTGFSGYFYILNYFHEAASGKDAIFEGEITDETINISLNKGTYYLVVTRNNPAGTSEDISVTELIFAIFGGDTSDSALPSEYNVKLTPLNTPAPIDLACMGVSNVTCDSLSEIDRLLDWAGKEYPALFGEQVKTFSIEGYLARHYPASNLYLGSKDREVYGYGAMWGGITHFGRLNELLEEIPRFTNLIDSTISANDEITVSTAVGEMVVSSTSHEPINIKIDDVVEKNKETSIHIEVLGENATIKLPLVSTQLIKKRSNLLKRSKNDYPIQHNVWSRNAWFLSVSYTSPLSFIGIDFDDMAQARLYGRVIDHKEDDLNKGWTQFDAKIREASRLMSVCKEVIDLDKNVYSSCEHKDKVPVLLIHGFQVEAFNSGFAVDLNNNGGKAYWGGFPNRLLDDGYLPFEFRWGTNARFEDVAVDLAEAIDLIYLSTGKKVHVVAHSFGGLVLRTLLQTDPDRINKLHHEALLGISSVDMLATVTTVGSPHSGIADKRKTMFEIPFPQGQDSGGKDVFEACEQLSCQLMGEDVISEKIGHVFKISGTAGEWAAELYRSRGNLPKINMQVLIGLALYEDREYHPIKYSVGFGDLLISGYGQRFSPYASYDDGWANLLLNHNVGKAKVSEFILGRGNNNTTNTIQNLKPLDPVALNAYIPFKHSGGAIGKSGWADEFSLLYDNTTKQQEVCIGCGSGEGINDYHDTYHRVKDWMGSKLICKSGETLIRNTYGAAFCETIMSSVPGEFCTFNNDNVGCDTQPLMAGIVVGTIKDAVTRTPIDNVKIEVSEIESGEIKATLFSDISGIYKAELPVGNYHFSLSVSGYIPTTVEANVLENKSTFVTDLNQISDEYSGVGELSGSIKDNITNSLIADIKVSLFYGVNTQRVENEVRSFVDEDGEFKLDNIPAGNYSLVLSGNTIDSVSFNIDILGGKEVTKIFYVTSLLNNEIKPIIGGIQNFGLGDLYQFHANKNDTIYIYADGEKRNGKNIFDSVVSLFDSKGGFISADDDNGTETHPGDAFINGIKINKTGNYLVYVGGFVFTGSNKDKSTGVYNIRVSDNFNTAYKGEGNGLYRLDLVQQNISLPIQISSIRENLEFLFYAKDGDSVTIFATPVIYNDNSENVKDPIIELFDTAGRRIAKNKNSISEVIISGVGRYSIKVTNGNKDQRSGYSLVAYINGELVQLIPEP